MKQRNQVSAAVLAALFSVVVLFSSVFIIEHADHDCVGENCPICEQLYSCAQNLKNLSVSLLVAASTVALAFSLCGGMKWLTPVFALHTPVLLKVKLSN